MAKLILSISISLLALAAAQCRGDEPVNHLNGTWQYVAAIESDQISTYDESSTIQLVVLDNTWALFKNGVLVPGTVENVEYNQQTSPVVFVRRKGKAPHAVGYGILKVNGGHLIYTITPLDATRFGSTSGAVGDYVPDSQSGSTDASGPFAHTDLADSRLYQHPPKSFSPEGTSNTQYILKRINDSTSLISQITKGEAAAGLELMDQREGY